MPNLSRQGGSTPEGRRGAASEPGRPRCRAQPAKPTGVTTLCFSAVRRQRPQHGLCQHGGCPEAFRGPESRSEGTGAACGSGARAGLGGGGQVPAAVTKPSAQLLASARFALTIVRRTPCQGQTRRWPSQDSHRGLGPQGPIPRLNAAEPETWRVQPRSPDQGRLGEPQPPGCAWVLPRVLRGPLMAVQVSSALGRPLSRGPWPMAAHALGSGPGKRSKATTRFPTPTPPAGLPRVMPDPDTNTKRGPPSL